MNHGQEKEGQVWHSLFLPQLPCHISACHLRFFESANKTVENIIEET